MQGGARNSQISQSTQENTFSWFPSAKPRQKSAPATKTRYIFRNPGEWAVLLAAPGGAGRWSAPTTRPMVVTSSAARGGGAMCPAARVFESPGALYNSARLSARFGGEVGENIPQIAITRHAGSFQAPKVVSLQRNLVLCAIGAPCYEPVRNVEHWMGVQGRGGADTVQTMPGPSLAYCAK